MPMWFDILVILLQVSYTIGALGLALYGAHALWLTWLLLRHRSAPVATSSVTPHSQFTIHNSPFTICEWPSVTVQLPIYNERHVIERLMDACAGFDYPKDRLQIQVLDDSDDQTTAIAQRRAIYWQQRGVNMELVRRDSRSGYKAGALAHALPLATGQFIAIFDADFAPPPEFLKQAVAPFLRPASENIGFVQGRWEHLNRNYSLLTSCQALALDGHFGVEQPGRAAAGLAFGFNGSAGVWRRACIEDAQVGGWQTDTLCEDLDLSYRAQLAGWRGVYLQDVTAPAEIPPQLAAFKRQQFRWAKGSVQTLRKLHQEVASSDWPASARLAGLLHLGNYLIHPLLLLLLLTVLPLLLADAPPPSLLTALSLASLGPPLLYAVAQRRLHGQRWLRHWLALPALMLLGLGVSLNNTIAIGQAFGHGRGHFLRTPKFHIESDSDDWRRSAYRLSAGPTMLLEMALALYALCAAATAIVRDNWIAGIFMALYALSFGVVIGAELWQSRGALGGILRRVSHSFSFEKDSSTY